jgi:hypothetical protein
LVSLLNSFILSRGLQPLQRFLPAVNLVMVSGNQARQEVGLLRDIESLEIGQ